MKKTVEELRKYAEMVKRHDKETKALRDVFEIPPDNDSKAEKED